MLDVVSSGEFYNHFIKLPDINSPVPDYIQNSPKLFPFFQNVLGATALVFAFAASVRVTVGVTVLDFDRDFDFAMSKGVGGWEERKMEI